MDPIRHQNDVRLLQARNRVLGLSVAGLTVCCALSLSLAVSLIGAQRTVIVPPSIQKSFWVSGGKAEAAYLEQMAAFVAYLILDVNAESIAWKKDMLLNFLRPEDVGLMQTRQDLEADRLRRINAATSFAPQQLETDEDAQWVIVRGRLTTRVNGTATSVESRAYLVEFAQSFGRIHLKTFKEVPYEKKPGSPVAASGTSG